MMEYEIHIVRVFNSGLYKPADSINYIVLFIASSSLFYSELTG